MPAVRCAVLPEEGLHKLEGQLQRLHEAVIAGGGEITDPGDAEAVIWAAHDAPDALRQLLADNPGIRWVQLPFAGIEPYVGVLDDDHTWTCGKGVYAEPVAEHALALTLGGMRGISRYARASSWSAPYGKNLLGAEVCILGGGEITRSLVRLLSPFGGSITVVRKRPDAIDGVDRVVGAGALHDVLGDADVVVLALALTPETHGIIDAAALSAMRDDAWLVNVARGRHVVTDDLVTALRNGEIGGAALDVTDPEPLDERHPLWGLDNVVITPHVGNTPEMGLELLARRITENVARYGRGEQLLGPVHLELGY